MLDLVGNPADRFSNDAAQISGLLTVPTSVLRSSIKLYRLLIWLVNMSPVMRKAASCIGKNKGADQPLGNPVRLINAFVLLHK